MKKLDVVVLILLPLLAVGTALAFKVHFLVSIFLFFGLPAVYLSWRNPQAVKRVFFFSLFAFPIGFIADYLAALNHAWYVPYTFFSRVLGIVPIEDLIWGFLLVYLVLIFYEHFLDKGKHKNVVDKNYKYGVYLVLAMLAIFFSAFFVNAGFLKINYVYLIVGALAFLPMGLFLARFPRFLGKYVKVLVYFICLNLLYELTALQLGWWAFYGKEYIGWVSLLSYKFPFEEFFFYIILVSSAILSYFELFDDDKLVKKK